MRLHASYKTAGRQHPSEAPPRRSTADSCPACSQSVLIPQATRAFPHQRLKIMADAQDWRSSVTALERYDNIQKLSQTGDATAKQSAFAIENEAYTTAKSRDEYDAACSQPTAILREGPSLDALAPEDDNTDPFPGIAIGDYENCHYVASGLTAEVYRAQTRALKVIVETHAIEPHNPFRETKILESLRAANAPNSISLLETFRDRDQRFVLVFPYMPFTLARLLETRQPLPSPQTRTIFTGLFLALRHLHAQGIIHRDVKPSAILLSSSNPSSPSEIHLSDFGTAWHPTLSAADEPPTAKVLDVGTGPYRAPETLFGNRAYGTEVDLWAAGATLAECLLPAPSPTTTNLTPTGRSTTTSTDPEQSGPTRTLFASRPAHEDGSQLGLILSLFQTLGTPTRETWPEATQFRTPPFDMYRVFKGRVAEEGWEGVLGGGSGSGNGGGSGEEGGAEWRELVAGLLRWESGERVTAAQALEFPCLKGERE